jgi:hypothetical protein
MPLPQQRRAGTAPRHGGGVRRKTRPSAAVGALRGRTERASALLATMATNARSAQTAPELNILVVHGESLLPIDVPR